MDKNKYLQMNSAELSRYLIPDVMQHSAASMPTIEELSQSRRYMEDYEFRIYVETARSVVYYMMGRHSDIFSLCSTLVERASVLELWYLVAVNLNMLGNAYLIQGIIERALEYFLNVIKCENDHGNTSMTATAYHNIALLYINLEAPPEKIRYYLQHSIIALEKYARDDIRYEAKWCIAMCYLSTVLCDENQLDEVKRIFDKVRRIVYLEKIDSVTLMTYYSARMYYEFFAQKFDQAKQTFQSLAGMIIASDKRKRADILSSYVDLCAKFEMSYDFYEDVLLELESMEESENSILNTRVYMDLRKYYMAKNMPDKVELVTHKYVEILENNSKLIRTRQIDSLDIVGNLVDESKYLSNIQSKNTELKLIAEEAIRNKNAMLETYNRMEIINNIGQKMTSSLKLEEVVALIYQSLNDKIPVYVFALMVAEPENNLLRTVAYYEGDRAHGEFSLKIDNAGSIFADCYRRNEWIVLNDIPNDKYFENKGQYKLAGVTKSAIFMPLNVGTQTIGVCSVQNLEKATYTKEHVLFLEQLLPYLSIALNNAIRSWKLESEIRSHLKTQIELEKANYRLELLSSLDGLTQISSRRDFEEKIMQMLDKAEKELLPVSVFMCDIDYFKLYNDNYGHLEGDEVLKTVAQTFRHNIDMVGGLTARFGGEEFIAACVGLTQAEIKKLANQICQGIYDLEIEHKMSPMHRVTISVGVAIAEKTDVSQKSNIIRLADICLYNAKNTGKNKVVLKKAVYGKQYTEPKGEQGKTDGTKKEDDNQKESKRIKKNHKE